MAVALATQIAQQLQPDGTYHWIVTIGGKTRDFGIVYGPPTGGTVTIPGGKAITAISPIGLITFSDNTTTQLVLTPGKSAKQFAIDAGLIPPNATDAQYAAFNRGSNGASAKQLAISLGALPANASDADFMAFLKGADGVSAKQAAINAGRLAAGASDAAFLDSLKGAAGPKPGLLATNTGLPTGNVYRLDDASGLWVTASPRSQELMYGTWGVSDQNTDLIAPGNVVKVNGSAFVAGQDYYLETVDANGCNYAALPYPMPASLIPSASRAFTGLGRTSLAPDGGVQLRIDPVYGLADGAAASKAIVIDPTDLPLGAQLGPGMLAYLLDAKNGVAETGGQDANKVLIDGDAAGGTGFMASPIIRRIGGVGKGVSINDVGYGGLHLRSPVRWPSMASGDFLFLFQVGGANNSLGLFFGYGGGMFYAVRVFGGPDFIGFRQYTLNGLAVSEANLGSAGNGQYLSASLGAKTLAFLRLNWNGAVLKARAWKYDTSKGINPAGLLRQGESEPSSWDLNYTHSAALPSGRAGYLYQQDYNHLHLLSYSPDPNVSAPYGGA